MMEELLLWLQHAEGPLAYFVLAGSSAFEYVISPFPGDTIALFGVFLAATRSDEPSGSRTEGRRNE